MVGSCVRYSRRRGQRWRRRRRRVVALSNQADDTIILFKVKTDIRLVHVKQDLAERQQHHKEPWGRSVPHISTPST
jgi:hypothetical protein